MNMQGRPIDNFAKDFGSNFDYSTWFSSPSMTVGPSAPPLIPVSVSHPGDPSASCVTQNGLFNRATETEHPLQSNSVHRPPPDPTEQHIRDQIMAFQRVDPRPFIPRGLNQIEVHARKPVERVVMLRPRPKHQNLAIVSINPMPEHQVTFHAIRDVVTDYLNNVQHVEFTNIQPTHLGQAYIRFRNVYDKDRLIQKSPLQFGDITISFVDHNKGRNLCAVNFNRECWLLLLGFLPDYREDQYVVNSISPFDHVMSWVDDENHMSRLLVRARVIDYESIPQFIVMTEGEGFQGESWTIQCEILQGNLLGGLPQDEDPAPGPDAFPPGGPYDYFGFGQPGNAPVV